jgi:hypothetical protein
VTNEERDIITSFIERVSGAARPASIAGSVPTTVTALPPIDLEADRLIGDLFARYPEARYRLTQTAFVQEHALAEAQSRISQLQAQLQQAQAAQQAQAPQSGGGFFHNLFGGGAQQAPPAYQPYQPQPQYAPQYPQGPGMFQRSGSGFLGSALTTAAGVAGGMIAGNALMNLFEGPREGFGGGGFGGGGFGGGGFGGDPASPWSSAVPDAQVTGSAWDNQVENSAPGGWDQGGGDSSVQPDTSGGGWDQADNSGGGGWDDGGSGGGDNSGGF